ncbi:MAG: FixH family protein [Deltaproteobacteria bacterium]|nr:FixH family protein [Deltaproteobacteria bacterium]
MKKGSKWPLAIGISLGVVFAVNIAFLSLALWSDDGLTDRDYYEKGLKYGERIKTERELGWTLRLSTVAGGTGIKDVKVSLLDRDGGVIQGAMVTLLVMRPATGGFDAVHELKDEAGLYKGQVVLPLEGWWDLRVTATLGGKSVEETFRLKA